MKINNVNDKPIDSQSIEDKKMKLVRFNIKNKANKPFLYFRGENIFNWFGINLDTQEV